jgi:hypothetical protein
LKLWISCLPSWFTKDSRTAWARQDRERGEPLVLGGSPGHVVGQLQETPMVGHRKSLGGHIR